MDLYTNFSLVMSLVLVCMTYCNLDLLQSWRFAFLGEHNTRKLCKKTYVKFIGIIGCEMMISMVITLNGRTALLILTKATMNA